MAVEILYDVAADKACLYDATTGQAFGPVFDDWESTDETKMPPEAEGAATARGLAVAFLQHLRADLGIDDPRKIDAQTLTNTYARWRTAVRYEEETR